MQTVIALVSGAAGAAIASGVFSIILYKIKRRDEKADKRQTTCSMHSMAIRYIMLYIIRAECERHIERGKITWEIAGCSTSGTTWTTRISAATVTRIC